jgi:hypothetical protein
MNMEHQERLEAQFRHLRQGERYRVQREFTDSDQVVHPVGEVWEFIGSNFVPYHDGLTLFAGIGGEECPIRLHWVPEGQAAVIESLDMYLVRCAGGV